MKLRTEIVWWLPQGYRVVYSGTPKTRWAWMKLTWKGYLSRYLLAWNILTLTTFLRKISARGRR